MAGDEGSEYLTPSEVAGVLHVSPKTVSRWASQGNLPCVVTLGGHRRFRRRDVENVLARWLAKMLDRPTPAKPRAEVSRDRSGPRQPRYGGSSATTAVDSRQAGGH